MYTVAWFGLIVQAPDTIVALHLLLKVISIIQHHKCIITYLNTLLLQKLPHVKWVIRLLAIIHTRAPSTMLASRPLGTRIPISKGAPARGQ